MKVVPHHNPRMSPLCFHSLVTEDYLNLHLVNKLQFSEKETQFKCKLTQSDFMDYTGWPKSRYTVIKLFFMCFEVTSSALYVAQK